MGGSRPYLAGIARVERNLGSGHPERRMMRRRRSKCHSRRSTRALAVGAVGMVIFGLIGSALVPVPTTVRPVRKRSAAEPARRPATRRASRRALPVSPRELVQAGAAARSFVDSYLLVAGGRAPTSLITEVAPTLRAQLSRGSARVTPDERRRHPRVVSVEIEGQEPGFVLATAVVGGAGVATYSLRMVIQDERRGWAVSELVGG